MTSNDIFLLTLEVTAMVCLTGITIALILKK
jgi:hypothetical protein